MSFLSRSGVTIALLSISLMLVIVKEQMSACPTINCVDQTVMTTTTLIAPLSSTPPLSVFQSGTHDRDSSHVQGFLRNAKTAKGFVPLEPFIDDTSSARPVMCKVSDRLFVGSQWAAIALSEGVGVGANITGILNVAFDLDVDFRSESGFVGSAEQSNRRHRLQLAKVGLVDGPGNHVGTLAAAVLTLRQMLDYSEPLLEKDATAFPIEERKVLVHCQMGRSRSILVVSLYLLYSKAFDTLDKALDYVKKARMVKRENFPRSELRDLAEKLLSVHPDLFEKF